MKIGIFDSGLGGLIITHALTLALPDYDYLYLGDTARVPYGNRSQAAIYQFTLQAVRFLHEAGCSLIIIACNTASSEALRRIQQEYLPQLENPPAVLGVLIPAAEAAAAATRSRQVGVLATSSTVSSAAFDRELHKLDAAIRVTSQAAPLLVPIVENDALKWAPVILEEYLLPLRDVDTLILGCTHYPLLKDIIRRQTGKKMAIISQDEIIPAKLADYLKRHPQLSESLSRGASRRFAFTDKTDQAARLAARLYGRSIELELVTLSD